LGNQIVSQKQEIIKSNFKRVYLKTKNEINLEVHLQSSKQDLESAIQKQENLFKIAFHKNTTPYVGVITKETNCLSNSLPIRKKLNLNNFNYTYWTFKANKKEQEPNCNAQEYSHNSCLLYFFHNKSNSLHRINTITPMNIKCEQVLINYIKGIN
jgi:hypothetical protein